MKTLLRKDMLFLGSGTLARLEEHTSHASVDAALISHAHPDHSVDLHMLFYARSFHPDPLPPLPLFMPPGAFDRPCPVPGGADNARLAADPANAIPRSSVLRTTGDFHLQEWSN